MKLGFLGAGQMATAIAGGLVQNNTMAASNILAADISPESRERFTAACGATCKDNAADIVNDVDALLVAVKPQYAAEAIAPVADSAKDKLIISIAAGLKLEKLCGWFNTTRVVRVMPNTPLRVGLGASVFCCAEGVSDADKEFVSNIFGELGYVTEMQEVQMDAVTALSGSGPAYIFEMIQAMVDGATALGLSADQALDLATTTVAGAAKMVAEKIDTPENLRIAVTSPGGTTAAGLKVMSDNNFRGLIADTLKAASDRSIELGK